MILSQVFSPFAYAVSGEEVPIPEPVVEEVVPEPEVGEPEVVELEVAPEVENSTGDNDFEIVESSTWEVPDVADSVDVVVDTGTAILTWEETKNLEEEEVLTWTESSSWFIEKIAETIKDFLWISWSENENFESKEIYWTWEYEWVKVEVYAQTWLFASWTELTIEPVIEDKLGTVQEVLLSWEVDLVEEQVIAFDITFRDPLTQEELQPKDWTVQVKFNYEDNESLVQAEENEEQEVKIYHLNDIDEEWNKIEELTWTIVEEVVVNEEESGEDNVMVVDAESFSVYTIVVQVRQEQLMNFEYWMISIANPSNSSQWITIMDRNLWATVAWWWIDAPVESYGYYYQWWNNYWFSSNSAAQLKTSYSRVNVSSFDEYYSDVFVRDSSWMSTWKNLWTAWSQWPCPEWWHIPTTSERDTLKSYYNSSYWTSFEWFVNYFNIPFAGYRSSNSTIWETNYRIAMWTSSTTNYSYSNNPYSVWWYTRNTSTSSFYGWTRSPGMAATVRCFKNSYEWLNSNLHTITFDYRWWKWSTTSINVKHGLKWQVPSVPIRLHSSFLWWYLLWTNTEFDFTWTTITEDISLYAKWSCNNWFIENESWTGCSWTYNFDANWWFFLWDESNTVQTLQYSCDWSDCYANVNLKNPDRVSQDISQQSWWMFAGWYMKSWIDGDWWEMFDPRTATTNTAYAKWLPFNDISIKDWDQVWFTIMDRNLWAESTSYWNDLDGMGYYYQWWNNYWFSSSSNVTIRTSSDKVDVSWYWPDNYYSSNIFIKSLPWDLSNNKNLWWWTWDSLETRWEWTDEDRQWPCPVGYHVPSTLEWNFAYNVWNSSEEKSTDEDSDYKNFVKDFKLPFAGYRSYYDVTVSSQGTYGYYLSSSPVSNSTSVYALYMKNDWTFNTQYSVATSYGYSLRCFKNLSKTKKIQYFTETWEKIAEYSLDWWDSIPYIDNHVERTWYEYVGWFEAWSNEWFDFSEDVARSVSLYERWVDIDWITEANTAKLLNWKKFNAAIKTLATWAVVSYLDFDEQIKWIERSEILPEWIVKKLISSDDSETPIFAWYDIGTQKIKYYTKAKDVYMNEDSSYMYYKIKNLSIINLEEFKTDYVRNMDWMFAYSCSSVDTLNLDFRNLNLSNVISMSNMFSYFFSRWTKANNITINFSKMDLSKVRNFDKMFYYSFNSVQNASWVTIDFSETDLSSVTNMNQMFFEFFYWNSNEGYNISWVTVDFSKADISGVMDGTQMFYYAFAYQKNLTWVLIDFSEVDMRNLTTMSSMFYDFCYWYTNQGWSIISWVVVDFSKADVRNVQNMNNMFEYAFAYARSTTWIEINFREANMSSVTNMYYMFHMFCYWYVNDEIWADISWVTIDFSKADMSSVDNMSAMFYYAFAYAKTITWLELNFNEADTRSVTNMYQMFYYFCYWYNYNYSIWADISWVTIDFSKTDMSCVTNMSAMFYYLFAYASNITWVVINFSDKDTSTIDVDWMTVDFSKADMSSVTEMRQMFYYGLYQARDISWLLICFNEADLSSVTDMYQMFNDFWYWNQSEAYNVSWVTIDFSKADLRSVENMSYMFYYMFAYQKNIKWVVIDFSEANMSSLTNIWYIFYDFCYWYNNLGWSDISWVTVNFSKADMSSLISMYQMFYYAFSYATNITWIEISFSEADLSSVTEMRRMFYDFWYWYNYADWADISWVIVDFSKADMRSVITMEQMFYYSFSYSKNVNWVEINFSEADIRSVATMYEMFYYFCYWNNITTNLIDIKWNNTKFTSSLSNMSNMFYYSYGITWLDLSSFDSSNVNNMSYMFNNARDLRTIYVWSRFRTNNVTSSSSMFYNATSLVGWRWTTYNSSNPMDKTYARVDKVWEPWYFTKKWEWTVATLLPWQEFNAKIKTMAKWSNATYNDSDSYIKRIKKGTSNQLIDLQSSNGTYEIVSTTYSEKPVYAWYIDSEKTIYYYSTADEIDMNTDASNMFAKLTKLEEVELEWIKTHGVSNMTSLFQNDESLTWLDLNNFDASSATNMQNMFNWCGGLKSVNLSNANMSRVTNITWIFGGCSNLESVDFSNADIRSLTSFASIFPGLPKLREVNFHKVNLNSLESTQGMFWWISSLKYADFSDANLKRVQTTESMFWWSWLTWADFSNADLRNTQSTSSMFWWLGTLLMANFENTNMMNVINMPSMFWWCNNLNRVTFSWSKMGNVTNMSYMFWWDSKLETVDFTKVNLSKLENMSSMFWWCSWLTWMDFSKMDLSRVTNMNGSFAAALKLESVNFWDNDFRNVTDMGRLFQNCISLEELDITKFDTRNVTNMNEMFRWAKNLKTIYVWDNFKTGSVTDGTDMFLWAESIVWWNWTKYESNYIGVINAKIDNEYYSWYFTDPNHFAVKYLTVTWEELLKQWISTWQIVEELEDSHKSYRYYTSWDLQTWFDFTELLYGYTEIYVAWDDVNYVTYEYWTWVEEWAISSWSCLIPRDNNWVAQSESCEVVLPELNVLTWYHTPLWYKKWTNIIYPNLTITLTWDVVLEAKATANNYTVVYQPWEWTWEMQSQEFEYDKEWTLNKNKYTKEWYHFNWWIDLLWKEYKDWETVLNLITEWILELTAQWLQNAPAAWWGRIIEQKNKVEDQEHESAEEKQEDQEIKQDDQQDKQQDETAEEQTKTPEKINNSSNQSTTQNSSNSSSSSKEITVTVDPEILSAYEWAYEYNVTTIPSLDEANPDWPVKRWHLAKMVVNYATNVLWREIPEKIPSECRWNDWRKDWESEEIKDYAVKSCALWLMWLDMPKFLPNLDVTRAQFGTIMSRLLWWKKYAWWTPYYRKHLNALKENNIMTQIENPEKRVELRQWVWLMLMRSAENN